MTEGGLRLLLIGSLPPPIGGTAVSFRQLVHELERRPDVAIEVRNTSREAPGRWLSRVWRLLWRLPNAIRRADVVTLHASVRGTVVLAPPLLALCRLLRRPLVLREFGGCLDRDYDALWLPARWLVQQSLRADRVLLQTRALVDEFRQRLPDARIEWYPNSRPLAAAKPPRAPRRPGTDLSLVYVGHVKPTKGVGEIVAAVERVPGCRVDVYGPLLDGFSESEFEASPRVVYRGELDPDVVVETLSKYDAVLLPTYHFGEGYPGIVLEAYSAGVPVVASRWRSIPEIVEDGVSGLLIEPRSVDDLARALRRLHDEPELLETLVPGARRLAERFDSRHWTQVFVDVCRAVAHEKAEA